MTALLTPTSQQPCALVLGAGGFIGAAVCARLQRAGWRVVRGVRPAGRAGADERACDMAVMHDAEAWLPVLDGVDAVVNAAGILRASRRDRFDAVHHQAPLALAQACQRLGISRFVQISALGQADDGEFVASKHRFDEALLDLLPTSLVLRPSVVYATAGSYGGTSLLRALAAVPAIMPLPGKADWLLQPLLVDDLAELVLAGLDRGCQGVYQVGGPRPISLRSYQLQWRHWLRIRGERCWHVPEPVIDPLVALADRFGHGPMSRIIWRMLRRGNVTDPAAHARLLDDFGCAPSDLEAVLNAQPSAVQDRWHAQLYLLVPALTWATILLWLLSAVTGWVTPAAAIEHMLAGSWLAGLAPVTLARATAALDLTLALWLAVSSRPRPVIGLMMLSVLAYSLMLGVALPGLWLDPWGGLAKNLVVLPALAMLWVLVDRR